MILTAREGFEAESIRNGEQIDFDKNETWFSMVKRRAEAIEQRSNMKVNEDKTSQEQTRILSMLTSIMQFQENYHVY